MKKLILLLLLSIQMPIWAQVCNTYTLHWNYLEEKEYLATLDPISGEVILLDSIPGVKMIQHGFSAMNADQGLFYFHGIDANFTGQLYSLSINDGSIVNSIDFPPSGLNGNFIEMHYHPFNNLLYALHWDFDAEMEYFISINPNNGELIKIDSLVDVKSVQLDFSALNYLNDEYYFIGIDENFQSRLYTLDVNTAAIKNAPLFPSNNINGGVNELEVDPLRGNLHSLHYDQNEQQEYFVRINPENGLVDKMAVIPNVQYIQSGFSALNSYDGQYYFNGIDSNNEALLYTIDIYTANVINTSSVSSNIYGGLNELKFPNISPVILNLSQTAICENDSSLLLAPQNFNHYLWSNGSTEDHIYVSDSAEYSLILTKDYGCEIEITPMVLSIYDCNSFIDSLVNIHDSCWIDENIVNMVYTDQVTIEENGISVRWNFVTNSADTLRLIDYYNPLENGLYDIGIGFSCDNKSETIYFHSMIEIEHMNPTSIDNDFATSNLKVYPNPANDYINIQGISIDKEIMDIYNINNQLIKSINFSQTNSNQINISDLKPGIYFALLRNSSTSNTFKFIKQ